MSQSANDGARLESIPGQRLGRARLEPLSPGERDLYDWVLAAFAAGTPPTPDALADAASTFDVDLDTALATFAREDLVHHDPATGAILVAYPFSGTPRGHRVRIDGKYEVEAMCAIDALGIAPMLDRQVEISSRDPLTGAEVWVRLDPAEGAWWEPETAVVLDGCVCVDGPSYRNWCAALNFFESGESALRYLIANPEISGRAISLPEAIEIGRTIFGDLLPQKEA
jgi:Alkylmercury lyase